MISQPIHVVHLALATLNARFALPVYHTEGWHRMAHVTDNNFKIFTLHIEGVSIDNVTLDDIGHYLEDFAELLGKDASPRYHSIRRGSLDIAAKVPTEREIEVKTRGFLLRTGDAPEEAVRARRKISKRLGIHRARKATLFDQAKVKVIEIPIEKPSDQIEIPALSRSGSVQGKVIRLGGRQDIVSVEIQDVDGHIYVCRAKRELVKRLVREIILFESVIRAHGAGKWRRGDDSVWYVEDFLITDFEPLDADSFVEVITQLRRVPSAWIDRDDSFDELARLRRGEVL